MNHAALCTMSKPFMQPCYYFDAVTLGGKAGRVVPFHTYIGEDGIFFRGGAVPQFSSRRGRDFSI